MAYFLDGPQIAAANGLDIVSDGIVMGAIQVLGDGRPMVLMADRQVTGGYPEDRDRDRTRSRTARADAAGLVGALCRHHHRRGGRGAARRARDSATRRFESVPLQKDSSAELLLGSNLISGVSGGAD